MAAMEAQPEGLMKAMVEEVPLSSTMLPWDRFSNWLHCACVVTFDLELGQAMEVRRTQHYDTLFTHCVMCFDVLPFGISSWGVS